MSIGTQLRAAREARGATSSEAAAATRMKMQHVEALERDDFQVFASPVYARGFIRIYAGYLGLDPAPLLAEYANRQAPPERPPLVPPAVARPARRFHTGSMRDGVAETSALPPPEPAADPVPEAPSEPPAPAVPAAPVRGAGGELEFSFDAPAPAPAPRPARAPGLRPAGPPDRRLTAERRSRTPAIAWGAALLVVGLVAIFLAFRPKRNPGGRVEAVIRPDEPAATLIELPPEPVLLDPFAPERDDRTAP